MWTFFPGDHVVVAKDYKGIERGRIGTVLSTGRRGEVSFGEGSAAKCFFGINMDLELADRLPTPVARALRRLRELWRTTDCMKFLLEEPDMEGAYDDFKERMGIQSDPMILKSCCNPTEFSFNFDPYVNPEKYDNFNEDCRCWDCTFKKIIQEYKNIDALQEENTALRRQLQDRQNFITAVRSMAGTQSITTCSGAMFLAQQKNVVVQNARARVSQLWVEIHHMFHLFADYDDETGVEGRFEKMMWHITWKCPQKYFTWRDFLCHLMCEFARKGEMQDENAALRLELQNIYTFIAAVQVIAERSRLHD